MKSKLLFFALTLGAATTSIAQYNTEWYYPNNSNSNQAGYIGIGTSNSTVSNTPLPNYNLHVHGVADYISSNSYSSLDPKNPGTIGVSSEVMSSINYGKTARIGLTNSVTGATDMEGAVLQLSETDFYVKNQANGDLKLSVPNFALTLSNSTSRLWLGGTPSTSATNARFNVSTSDNGLFIQTHNTLKYGMRIQMASNTADAVQIYGQGGTTKNFKVTGSGEVFARKYTTTLNNIPDYVFADDYQLMPLSDLRTFVATEKHLPNIPSAVEYAEEGVDLGEMNRLLLEKVEELTLYVLELEERLNNLEEE